MNTCTIQENVNDLNNHLEVKHFCSIRTRYVTRARFEHRNHMMAKWTSHCYLVEVTRFFVRCLILNPNELQVQFHFNFPRYFSSYQSRISKRVCTAAVTGSHTSQISNALHLRPRAATTCFWLHAVHISSLSWPRSALLHHSTAGKRL